MVAIKRWFWELGKLPNWAAREVYFVSVPWFSAVRAELSAISLSITGAACCRSFLIFDKYGKHYFINFEKVNTKKRHLLTGAAHVNSAKTACFREFGYDFDA